ncbi:hypothetical protein PAPYR_10564 [Paratrimastix pyriformis]|uniref:Condensation domain-containing protein n=1 Tax=Paratrimastix pyriformis TaxID=342808 RepID=A0ABQ8U5N1_9EUKA|nr:hypothetical protein PAPYR_10564 [Paratrimastix pyriformis]
MLRINPYDAVCMLFPIAVDARLAGPLIPAEFSRAVKLLSQKHQYPLQYKVVSNAEDPRALFFEGPSSFDLPIEFETRDSLSSDFEVVMTDLHRGISRPDGVLRFHVLSAGDQHELIVLTEHCYDGRAAITLVDDLLRLLADIHHGESPHVEPLVPIDINKVLPLDALAKLVFPRATPEPYLQLPALPATTNPPSDSRRQNLRVCVFDEDKTRRLVEACRAHGASVQAAINVAVGIATYRMQGYPPLWNPTTDPTPQPAPVPAGPITVQAQCVADIRPLLSGLEGASPLSGNVTGALRWADHIDPDEDIWLAAARQKRRIQENMASGQVHALRVLISPALGPAAQMAGSIWLQAAPTYGPSNVGVVPIQERYGPFAVHEVVDTFKYDHLPALAIPCEVLTFAGRLHLNFLWVAPFYSAPFANRFADGAVAALEAMIGHDDPERPLLTRALMMWEPSRP